MTREFATDGVLPPEAARYHAARSTPSMPKGR